MKSMPTQERALKKRVALLKAATHEFGVAGFEAATAKSIATKAGVATGTFYQYFENKNDILCVVAENRFTDLHHQVSILEGNSQDVNDTEITRSEQAKELFNRVLHFLYNFHIQDGLLHQVLEQRRGVDEKLDEIITRGEELMRSHVVQFLEDYELDDSMVVADSLFAMGEGLVHRMVFGSKPDNPDKMLEIGATILTNFLSNRP